jgi:hypothetical protein
MTYAADLVPALEGLRDLLIAAGVRASLDRATLPVPGAWVRPDSTAGYSLAGDGRARVSVLLVCPQNNKDSESLRDLTRLLDKALTVIDPDDDVDTSVVLPVGQNNLPAFRLVVDLDLKGQ